MERFAVHQADLNCLLDAQRHFLLGECRAGYEQKQCKGYDLFTIGCTIHSKFLMCHVPDSLRSKTIDMLVYCSFNAGVIVPAFSFNFARYFSRPASVRTPSYTILMIASYTCAAL